MKDLHKDDIFGSVRERMGRYEEAPSDELWNRIATHQRSKDRVWPILIEATGLVGMGVLVFSLLNFEVRRVEEIKVSTVEETQPEVVVLAEKPEEIKAQRPLAVFKDQEVRQEQKDQQETLSEPPLLNSPSPQVIQNEPGQEIEKEKEAVPPYKKPKSKFQFYLSVTPSLSFQKLTPSGNDNLVIQGLEHRSPMSMKRFGFGIDAGFQRDINRTLGFYGGISFYRQQQELTYLYYDKDPQVTRLGDEWVFEINRQQHSKTFDYSMTNVGVSSGLLVTLKGEKLKHKFGAGLMFSINNKRSGYLAYQLFYRNELEINDHLGWFIEPTFIYSLISKEKLNEPFTLKPYRAGITTGVIYRWRSPTISR